MKHLFLSLIFLLFLSAGTAQEPVSKKWLMKPIRYPYVEYGLADVKLSEKEYHLYRLLMDYREANGLPDIPLSKALTFVAQVHAGDLTDYYKMSNRCTFNSWSRKGEWKACCYRKDHSKAACMWNKPRELTTYTGDGFELTYWHLWTPTPEGTLGKMEGKPAQRQGNPEHGRMGKGHLECHRHRDVR